jgi:fatty-acyl-CoA synthase
VIGVPHERWGECGKAFLAADSEIGLDDLREHCLKNLAKFKVRATAF